jgi:hypothetical protein
VQWNGCRSNCERQIEMSTLVPIVIFGWIPTVLVLMAVFPPRTVVAASIIGGWLFLPNVRYEISGLPDFTKMSASCLGVILGMSIFDFRRLLKFRISIWDCPIILWCISPLLSSLSNDLGVYDGLSGVFGYTVNWGVPYFIGRIYFSDLEGIEFLAKSALVGGLAYMPLCLIEIRFSPQLHKFFYGYYASNFSMNVRGGGFRPTVFMGHGLMVGLWMGATTTIAFWLWVNGILRQIWHVPASWIVCLMVLTTILCKSLGSLAITMFAIAALAVAHWTRSRLAIALFLASPIVFMCARTTGLWNGSGLTELSRSLGGSEREGSLGVRLMNDNILIGRALERPVFGWGGWNRQRVFVEGRRSITDAFWTIALGQRGLVGLVAIYATFLMPLGILIWKCPQSFWQGSVLAPAIATAVVIVMYAMDCLFNGMLNPIYLVAAGGSTGFVSNNLAQYTVDRFHELVFVPDSEEFASVATSN